MPCVRHRRLAATAILVIAASSAAATAAAPPAPAPTELAAARELFAEGVALERQDAWSGALAKFQKAAAIVVTPKVRFHVALCFEHTGRLVEAINEFTAARNLARTDALDGETATAAEQHLASLQTTVPRLTIKVGAEAPAGASVRLDGATLNASLWGVDVPIAWKDGGSTTGTGNSFAAPHISGLLARLRSTYPDATPFEAKTMLAFGASTPIRDGRPGVSRR